MIPYRPVRVPTVAVDHGFVRKRPWDRESWRGELAGWCRRWLGADPADELFVAGWQSAVVGVGLSDGRRVVVKIRRPAARLMACHQVQEHLWRTGFCCPRPLRAPTRLGPFVATAEEFVGGGTELPDPTAHVEELAGVLADLVGRASHLPIRSSLAPAPDWAGWNHSGTGIWSDGGADEVDLNHTPEPGWLTELVTALGRHLRATRLPPVIGHVDWESPNLCWTGVRIGCVYDWDSVCALPEAAIAGLAATVFPVRDDGPGATVEQTEEFLAAYAATRGRPWNAEERRTAWAAGLWVLAFNAKAEAVDGVHGPLTRRLEHERIERTRNAGIVVT